MESKFYLWFTIFFVGVGVWFYSNVQIGVDYERNFRLIDPFTGTKQSVKEFLRLSKVLEFDKDEYIEETNAEERLHDLVSFSNLENTFLLDQSYTDKDDLIKSGWPVANKTACSHHLQWIQNQLNVFSGNYTLIRGKFGHQLTTYMDSFGRTEAGMYSGIIHWMGSYKQCMRANLDNGRIKTRYCIGRMKAKSWPQNDTIYPVPAIRIGICIPETCDTQSFDEHKSTIEYLAKFQLKEFYQSSYDLKSMFCLPDERSPLRQIPLAGWLFIYGMSGWCLLVVLATIIHDTYYRQKKSVSTYNKLAMVELGSNGREEKGSQLVIDTHLKPKPIVQADDVRKSIMEKLCEDLSLRCSLKSFKTKIFRVKYAQGQRVRVNLGVLDFYKSIMTMMVVLGHSGYLNQTFSRSLTNRIETSTDIVNVWGLSICICVDTFFLIFGILATYNIMRKFKSHQLGNPMIWFMINVRIFIRITPVFFIIHWYTRYVSPYTDSGPWWDYGVDIQSLRGQCWHEPWWLSIPVFAAYKPMPISMCVPQSWFIVSYLQIATFLPLVTYILYKLPKHSYRIIFVSTLTLISSVYILNQVYHSESLPAEFYPKLGTFLADILDKFEISGYRSAFGRLGCVCVGCYVGFLIRQYEEGHIAQWPNWLRQRKTTIIAGISMLQIMSVPLFVTYFYKNYKLYLNMEPFVVLNLLRSIIWPLTNCIFFIGLSTTLNHTAFSRFNSHALWYTFNKLGLAIYLMHWEVLYVLMSSFEHAPPSGLLREDYRYWTTTLIYTAAISLFLHLFVEVPAEKLISFMDRYIVAPKPPINGRKNEQVIRPQGELGKVIRPEQGNE